MVTTPVGDNTGGNTGGGDNTGGGGEDEPGGSDHYNEGLHTEEVSRPFWWGEGIKGVKSRFKGVETQVFRKLF